MGSRRKIESRFLMNLIIMLYKLMLAIASVLLKAIIWMLWIVLPGVIYFIWSIWGYSKSEYKQATNNSLLSVYLDKGKRGEYLIYRHLKGTIKNAQWLFNLYLPRDCGKTTEIDVMMIHTSGIYVFESKNYSGWIFGSQDRDQWTQCIKPDESTRVKKYHFLNPLKQNDTHVRYLKPLLPSEVHQHIFPIVVFGNQCKLKKIGVQQHIQPVVRRKDIKHIFNERIDSVVISEAAVRGIYDSLFKYSQVDESIKLKHIEDIDKIKSYKI